MSNTSVLDLPDSDSPQHGSIFLVGTATTIIRFGGFTILIAPQTGGSTIDLDELPPVDFCFVPQVCEVHLLRLNRYMPMVTTRRGGARLLGHGFQSVTIVSSGQPLQIRKGLLFVTLTLAPHDLGAVFEYPAADGRSLRVYCAGDNVHRDQLAHTILRFGDIDMALLQVDGTRVLGVLSTVNGVKSMQLTRPGSVVPIQNGPLSELQVEVERAALASHVAYLKYGDPRPPKQRQRRAS